MISLLTVTFLVVTVMLWFDERGSVEHGEHGKKQIAKCFKWVGRRQKWITKILYLLKLNILETFPKYCKHQQSIYHRFPRRSWWDWKCWACLPTYQPQPGCLPARLRSWGQQGRGGRDWGRGSRGRWREDSWKYNKSKQQIYKNMRSIENKQVKKQKDKIFPFSPIS